MLEFYIAYADYNDLIEIVENLLVSLFSKLIDQKELIIKNDETGEETKIDLLPPFKRIDFMESLEKELNCKLPDAKDLDKPEANERLKEICKQHNIEFKEAEPSTQRCLDKLVSKLVEPKLINPTFLMNYPEVMSPLAKQHRSKAGLTERFELFMNGLEISNGYTELNDPQTQRERFEKLKQEESNVPLIDEMFCLSLEYGLPPTGGVGLGIDRLVKLVTCSNNLREIILFPTLKPDQLELKEFLESNNE